MSLYSCCKPDKEVQRFSLPRNAQIPGLLPFAAVGPALVRNDKQQHFPNIANAQLPRKPLMLRDADPGELQCGATPGKVINGLPPARSRAHH